MREKGSGFQLSLTATVWLIAAILAITAVIASYLLYADLRQQRILLDEVRSIERLRTALSELNGDLQLLEEVIAEGPGAAESIAGTRQEIADIEALWQQSGQPADQIAPLIALAETRIEEALAGNEDKTPHIAFQTEALRISSVLTALSDPRQSEERNAMARWRFIAGSLVIFMALALGLAILALRRALRSHKQMLEQAEEQTQRLTAMFNGSGDGMLSLDIDGRILDMNRSAKTMLGAGPKVYKGKPLNEIVKLDAFSGPSFRDMAARLRARDEAVYETEANRRNGTTFRAGLTLGVYYIGGQLHYIATLRDITRRKMLEEAKNAFVSTVSHELRTPLTAIAGSLDLLRVQTEKEKSSDQTKRLLQIAQSNSRRLINLINDILDIEKLESGRAAMDLEDVSLRELAREAIEANTSLGASRNVSLKLEAGSDVMVRADKDRLMQIATNFISNAIKFSPDKGCVTLLVRRIGTMGELAVSDEGPGVPAEFRPHLFEKFSQADDARIKGQGSTGLGLAISREIAEQLDGEVRYLPAEGGGAMFAVRLPSTRITQAAPEKASNKPRILHFDPDRDTLRVVADAFGTSAQLLSVSSLAELSEAAEEFAPDLVIVDPSLRAKLVRSELERIMDNNGSLPLIAFTSLDREALPDIPFDAHLVKSRTPVTGLVTLTHQFLNPEMAET
ncbi:ATP-binding protein [Hyphobacterium sp. HN65]|uniref:histidine kinase n=1 Tax=Hyphobacterium lacteum TaxID=3116575 RepID=A0ABU7LSC3_9PROT|nr:ATP-binding protein [Hyphobacterium sp. HN65]MEE2526806.1 ATP-binding protein [Hyphobacterium sp. HN65]